MLARAKNGERKRPGGEERETYTDADGQCRLVYQSGIVGAIVALLDTPFVGYISGPRRARDYSILSFIHSSETLFIFLLSLTPPRNKNRPGSAEDRGAAVTVAVAEPPRIPAFALTSVISLKSNCTRKNGSPLSGKRIARHREVEG